MNENQDPKKPNNNPLNKLNESTNNDFIEKDIRNIIGLIETVSVIPNYFPKKFFDSIKIYESGTTYRLYIYSQTSKTWRYVALS